MVRVVDEMLIVQRGQELGYKLSDEQFNAIIDNIKKENNIDTDEQLDQALKQENVTMAELRAQLEKQMLIARVEQNEVFDRVAVIGRGGRAATTTRTCTSSRRPRRSDAARDSGGGAEQRRPV